MPRAKKPTPKTRAKPQTSDAPPERQPDEQSNPAKPRLPRARVKSRRSVVQVARGVETARKAVDLRVRGKTVRQIAEALGLSVAAAHGAIERGLQSTLDATKVSADQLRALETDRLERLLDALQTGIDSGDPRAIDSAARISARLSALHGLDAPTRTELTGKDGAAIQHAVGSLADVLRMSMEAEAEAAPPAVTVTAAIEEGVGAGREAEDPAPAETAGEGVP